MILSAPILGETAGAGTHQSKSKKGPAFYLLANLREIGYNNRRTFSVKGYISIIKQEEDI